ncbi:sensor histidine kinase [Tsukamurella paurometabola]|uniref:histidine kinase n=1 Tax=Tsukamurella paurometabola TaxID=2061 RepID=A0A3P8L1L0_TSUPA|nr:sensor histidine kinase [Tsukamurella paurometabola]MBS4101576.1 sensor histidine kinase [Tsukamurella paurometabola]UEA81476.1 sensor histidine kinase [Tsukamurella paurometabola]VDR38475.1 Sensor histidine kinase desK [Tsukamurella paurometabola]
MDSTVAVICFAWCTGPEIARSPTESSAWAAGLVGAAAIAPTVLCRRFPVLALGCVSAVLILAELADLRFTWLVSNAGPAFGIAVGWAAYRLPWRASLIVCAVAAIGVSAVGFAVWTTYSEHDQDAVQLIIAIPAWLLGTLLGREGSHRSRHLAEQLEIEAQKEARIRAEERLRVSREIHDVVSHSLSMIALRSGVARMVIDHDPDEARTALSTIEESSRRSLDDVRRVLGTIRDASPPLCPRLSDLEPLVATHWPGALRVSLDDRTDHTEVDPQVQTTVYRIVQEALTNAVRHSRAANVNVEIAVVRGELTVRITDDGAGTGDGTAPGLGLTGMRERVATHGGALTAGNIDGGYRIEAVIPS